MATTPEGKVKRAVSDLLASAGAYRFMPVSTGFGSMELDYICAHPLTRRLFFVETKAPGQKLKPHQAALITRHAEQGHPSFVLDGGEGERDAGHGFKVTPMWKFRIWLADPERYSMEHALAGLPVEKT